MDNFIKEKLLNLNILIQNEYFNKYVELITNNLKTKREKFKTQKHHIIPRCYFKHESIKDKAIIEDKTNLVNLSYANHILAHYYLSLCSAKKWFEYYNVTAFMHLSNSNKDEFNSFDLSRYNEIYKKHSEYVSENISGRYVGHVHIFKDKVEKHIKPDELNDYLNKGWTVGTLQNKIWVNKDFKNYRISKEEVETYLNNGYSLGRGTFFINNELRQKWRNQRKEKIYINNGKENKTIKKSNLTEYLDLGWTVGKLTRDEYSSLIWINKDNINKRIYPNELDNYLNSGWQKGRALYEIKNKEKVSNEARERRLKQLKLKGSEVKNTVWIHKNNVNKRVKKENLNVFINDNWCLGKMKRG